MTTRIAVVTGAAQGIGRAIAERLAADGLDVAINDLKAGPQLDSLKEVIEAKGRRCLIVPADVSNEDDVKGLIEKVVAEFGALDVFIANAGISDVPALPIVDLSLESWDRHFKVNATGTFLCYKYAGKQMVAQGRGGRIVGASSITGKRGMPGLAAYSATKAVVQNLTMVAAQEFGPSGITVNAFAPGMVDTPMSRSFFMSKAEGLLASSVMSEIAEETERKEAIANHIWSEWGKTCSMQRLGRPEDIANLVSMLVKPESDYINGQTITCDGGKVFM